HVLRLEGTPPPAGTPAAAAGQRARGPGTASAGTGSAGTGSRDRSPLSRTAASVASGRGLAAAREARRRGRIQAAAGRSIRRWTAWALSRDAVTTTARAV